MECLCLSSDWLCRVFRTPSKVQIWSQEWWGACPCTKEKLWAAAIAASVGWREIHSANQFPQKGLSCAKTPPVLSFQDGRMKWMPAVLTLSFVFRVDERDFPGDEHSLPWSLLPLELQKYTASAATVRLFNRHNQVWEERSGFHPGPLCCLCDLNYLSQSRNDGPEIAARPHEAGCKKIGKKRKKEGAGGWKGKCTAKQQIRDSEHIVHLVQSNEVT